MGADEVDDLVERGLLLQPIHEHNGPDQIPFPERVQIIHHREHVRLRQASLRAEAVHSNKGSLRMTTPAYGLEGSLELQDLLEYLADQLTYSHLGYLRDESGRRVVPTIVKETGWHCSQQSPTNLLKTSRKL